MRQVPMHHRPINVHHALPTRYNKLGQEAL